MSLRPRSTNAGCRAAGGRSVLVDGIGTPISCTAADADAEDASDGVEGTATVDANGEVSYEVL